MKILQASMPDLAGIAIALSDAVNSYTEHECRAIRRDDNYIRYPQDIQSSEGAVWREWVNWADVVVVHEYVAIWQCIKAIDSTKPVVWMAHGSYFRSGPARDTLNSILDTNPIPVVCSTPDLLPLRMGSTWMPKPMNMDYSTYRPGDPKIVVQTKTSGRKGNIRGLPEDIIVDVVTGVSHGESLARKRRAWAVVDQIGPSGLGLGVSGLEAMAMGIPVISGGPDTIMRYLKDFWGYLPFIPSTEERLCASVETLKFVPNLRDAWANIGRKHIQRHHNPEYVASKLVRTCEGAL